MPMPLHHALVVNDVSLARWALHEALTSAGFAVTVAETSEAALSAIAVLDALEVVVVSLSLGSDAVDCLKQRVFARWPKAGVIILATDVETRLPEDEDGRGVVLDTPFSIDDVVAAAKGGPPARLVVAPSGADA